MSQPAIIRIKPNEYIHVLDTNTHVTRVEAGPQIYTRKEHEKVVRTPTEMVMIPPRCFCKILNPVVKVGEEVKKDKNGNVVLRWGDHEIRTATTAKDPFPLYPGESLVGRVEELKVVGPNTALRLMALRDFEDNGILRRAGDEYLFVGSESNATYTPKVEESVLKIVRAHIIKENQALKLIARLSFVDEKTKKRRLAGEQWLVREAGAYLPRVEEEVVDVVDARILTETKALRLRATAKFTDYYGVPREPGTEWLVTIDKADTHIQDVSEVIVEEVTKTTLTARQYCVILNPVDEHDKPQWGKKKLVQGEISFFLKPGEKLQGGRVEDIKVLSEEQALLLTALETFADGDKIRKPGERWLIRGPRDYIPPIHVQILDDRETISLDESEGIYVRDLRTGEVRTEIGKSYLLKEYEKRWEKELPPIVEELLTQDAARDARLKGVSAKRDKTRVVTYRVPHNAAVQIYDYKKQTHRIVFGPELIMLQPDEHFTVLSLSGGKPKRPDVIPALCLFLGPDFMTDIVTVETSDHARLSLQLAFNWHFDVTNPETKKLLFQVPDFVGDACKAIASRIRGAVASQRFDHFHKRSAEIITKAVFGTEADGETVKSKFRVKGNGLVITSVDIQAVEPVDSRTQESLQRSVQLAIEITTKAQEATARHESEIEDEVAKGELERMKIKHKADAERSRTALVRLQSKTAALEAIGQATAEAQGKAEAAETRGKAMIEQATHKAKALSIQKESELTESEQKHKAEIAHKTALAKLEVDKAKKLADIEALKFKQIVDAIGADTIQSIATAEPEMQAELLKGLGLSGFMITDGTSPINLFNTAHGLIGGAMGAAP